jgi:hypothetical protein
LKQQQHTLWWHHHSSKYHSLASGVDLAAMSSPNPLQLCTLLFYLQRCEATRHHHRQDATVFPHAAAACSCLSMLLLLFVSCIVFSHCCWRWRRGHAGSLVCSRPSAT